MPMVANQDRVKEIQKLLTDLTNSSERQGEEDFYQALIYLHPTLQQAWWRITKQVINRYAESEGFFADPRNQRSVEYCKELADSRGKYVALPTI